MSPVDVAYDPVAGDLTVAGPEGRPAFHAPATGVLLKQYRDAGALLVRLDGQDARVAFVDLDHRAHPLALTLAGDGWWRVDVN